MKNKSNPQVSDKDIPHFYLWNKDFLAAWYKDKICQFEFMQNHVNENVFVFNGVWLLHLNPKVTIKTDEHDKKIKTFPLASIHPITLSG